MDYFVFVCDVLSFWFFLEFVELVLGDLFVTKNFGDDDSELMDIDIDEFFVHRGECLKFDNEFVVGLRECFEDTDMEFG